GFGVPTDGGAGASGTTTTNPRVSVVPDPAINAVLIKAAPIDVVSIRKMIKDYLDVSEAPIAKNHILKMTVANADEVAETIRELYRQVMDVNPIPGQAGGRGSQFISAL